MNRLTFNIVRFLLTLVFIFTVNHIFAMPTARTEVQIVTITIDSPIE